MDKGDKGPRRQIYILNNNIVLGMGLPYALLSNEPLSPDVKYVNRYK